MSLKMPEVKIFISKYSFPVKNTLRKAERGSAAQVVLTPPAKLGLDGAGKEYTWLQINKQKPTMGEETFF